MNKTTKMRLVSLTIAATLVAGALALSAMHTANADTGTLPSWIYQATPVANWSAINCPPPIYPIGASAMLSTTLDKPDVVLQLNVSRDLPADKAAAGPRNESNVLISLAPGISKTELVWDGSGYAYPMEMTLSKPGCRLDVETRGRGGNWPTSLTGIPNGIFQYYYPYGKIEAPANEQRWPDKIYGLRWWDSAGEHVWVNPLWANDPSVVTAGEWWLQSHNVDLTQTEGVTYTKSFTPSAGMPMTSTDTLSPTGELSPTMSWQDKVLYSLNVLANKQYTTIDTLEQVISANKELKAQVAGLQSRIDALEAKKPPPAVVAPKGNVVAQGEDKSVTLKAGKFYHLNIWWRDDSHEYNWIVKVNQDTVLSPFNGTVTEYSSIPWKTNVPVPNEKSVYQADLTKLPALAGKVTMYQLSSLK